MNTSDHSCQCFHQATVPLLRQVGVAESIDSHGSGRPYPSGNVPSGNEVPCFALIFSGMPGGRIRCGHKVPVHGRLGLMVDRRLDTPRVE